MNITYVKTKIPKLHVQYGYNFVETTHRCTERRECDKTNTFDRAVGILVFGVFLFPFTIPLMQL